LRKRYKPPPPLARGTLKGPLTLLNKNKVLNMLRLNRKEKSKRELTS